MYEQAAYASDTQINLASVLHIPHNAYQCAYIYIYIYII